MPNILLFIKLIFVIRIYPLKNCKWLRVSESLVFMGVLKVVLDLFKSTIGFMVKWIKFAPCNVTTIFNFHLS